MDLDEQLRYLIAERNTFFIPPIQQKSNGHDPHCWDLHVEPEVDHISIPLDVTTDSDPDDIEKQIRKIVTNIPIVRSCMRLLSHTSAKKDVNSMDKIIKRLVRLMDSVEFAVEGTPVPYNLTYQIITEMFHHIFPYAFGDLLRLVEDNDMLHHVHNIVPLISTNDYSNHENLLNLHFNRGGLVISPSAAELNVTHDWSQCDDSCVNSRCSKLTVDLQVDSDSTVKLGYTFDDTLTDGDHLLLGFQSVFSEHVNSRSWIVGGGLASTSTMFAYDRLKTYFDDVGTRTSASTFAYIFKQANRREFYDAVIDSKTSILQADGKSYSHAADIFHAYPNASMCAVYIQLLNSENYELPMGMCPSKINTAAIGAIVECLKNTTPHFAKELLSLICHDTDPNTLLPIDAQKNVEMRYSRDLYARVI